MRIRLGGTVLDDNSASLYRRCGYTNVCCPGDIRDAIRKCPKDEELVFEINSTGGSVYNGFEMYTVLRQEGQGRNTIAEIQSIAASAAAVFTAGCTTVRCSPVGNFMIHRASTGARGNAGDLRQATQMLDTVDESILNALEAKCGGKCSRDEIKKMLEGETFMTAQEALEKGFVDEILFSDSEPENMIQNVAASLRDGLGMVMAQLPPIDDLKRRSGVEDTTENQEKEEPKMTLEELKEKYPELANQLRSEGADNERKRLEAIDGMAMAGYEDIVEAAKKDPTKTANDVAAQIVLKQKQQGQNFLDATGSDVADGNVNQVEAGGEKQPSAEDELNDALNEAFPK